MDTLHAIRSAIRHRRAIGTIALVAVVVAAVVFFLSVWLRPSFVKHATSNEVQMSKATGFAVLSGLTVAAPSLMALGLEDPQRQDAGGEEKGRSIEAAHDNEATSEQG